MSVIAYSYLSMRITLNHHSIRLESQGNPELRIPGTSLYFPEHTTLGEIVECSDLKTFDYAMPQSFYNAYYDRYKEVPRGVWSYDQNWFGEYVSLAEILIRIGKELKSRGITTLYGMA